MSHVLLVEPEFPIPSKSRNHKDFLPVGLLKIAAMERSKGNSVELVRGLLDTDVPPNRIYITSYFTYWCKWVKEAVEFYKTRFPSAEISVGGIYASLMPEHCKEYTGCDVVETGQIAEDYTPAYDLVDVDYQILHTTRGCNRRCKFCGSYIIEEEYKYKSTIKEEITKKKLVLYDNNFLANPFVESILEELIDLKKSRKIRSVECQSGFDGRILLKKPHLAKMLKDAGFISPKIAWDNSYLDEQSIRKQLDILIGGGYSAKQISVFMLYNWDINYYECEYKRSKCFEWGIQIMDCRFRPLDLVEDNYNPRKHDQSDYYIHETWTNEQVRMFRKNVRRHNISIRQNMDYHSKYVERKLFDSETLKILREQNYDSVDLEDKYSPASIDFMRWYIMIEELSNTFDNLHRHKNLYEFYQKEYVWKIREYFKKYTNNDITFEFKDDAVTMRVSICCTNHDILNCICEDLDACLKWVDFEKEVFLFIKHF